MKDTDKKEDQEFNDTLKRMLKTPPKPKVNKILTKSTLEEKPSDNPVKKSHSET